MIWNLDFIWLAIAFAVVGIIAFMLSLALDAIMSGEGFGPSGNAFILAGGFFLSIYGFNWYGIRFREAAEAAMMGTAGAFALFFVLALAKAAVTRL